MLTKKIIDRGERLCDHTMNEIHRISEFPLQRSYVIDRHHNERNWSSRVWNKKNYVSQQHQDMHVLNVYK